MLHTSAADEAAERRRLASIDTMELVELWERPMSAASRALVLTELERRRYRTKSLPLPPAEDAAVDPLPTPDEIDRRHMHWSTTLLLVVGVLHILFAVYDAWQLRNRGLLVALIGTCMDGAVGVAFLAVYRVARVRPHPALTIGLLLYVALQVVRVALVLAFGEPSDVVAGLPVAILVLIGLTYGASVSRRRARVSSSGWTT